MLRTVYAEHDDMTFILEEYVDEKGRQVTECVGWYYGEPDDVLTRDYAKRVKHLSIG